MHIIISPSKKMHIQNDVFAPKATPRFINRSKLILDTLKTYSDEKLQKLWGVSDSLFASCKETLLNIDFKKASSPALFSYIGLQYDSLGTNSLDEKSLCYLENRLFILSGFYGVLKPYDAIVPYRLEMQAKMSVSGFKDLYAFWFETMHDFFNHAIDDTILDLASKEYSKAVSKAIDDKKRIIKVSFLDRTKDGKLKEFGTYSKKARGAMLRFMAENAIDDINCLKDFNLGYIFDKSLSDANMLCFVACDK